MEVVRTRDMAGGGAVRIALRAGEAAGRAGVDHLLGPAVQIGAHLVVRAQCVGSKRGVAWRERGRGLSRLQRPALGPPFGETAVEDRDRADIVVADQPPARAALFHGLSS